MEKIVLKESCKLINQHFELEIPSLLPEVIESLDFLKKELTKVITDLLNNDFERLLHIMYRIDIDEQKFNQAFTQKENIAYSITDLVIERELQKVQSRLNYRNTI